MMKFRNSIKTHRKSNIPALIYFTNTVGWFGTKD